MDENNCVDDEELQVFLEEDKDINEVFLCFLNHYPHIYSKDLEEHKDAIAVENSWMEIAAQMHEDVSMCKARWNKLKNAYNRENLVLNKETRSGSGATKRIKNFSLYNTIKSMLSTSQSKRKETSNLLGSDAKQLEGFTSIRKYTTKSFARKNHSQALLMRALTSHQEKTQRIEDRVNQVLHTGSSKAANDPSSAIQNLLLIELNRMSPANAARKRSELLKLCSEEEESLGSSEHDE